MLRDLKLGWRLLWRQPGFALTAILTLALGIGANTTIFSVAWNLLLKPLPYAHGDRLVEVWEAFPPQDAINPVAPGNYHDIERGARSFDAIAAYTYFGGTSNLTGGGDPELLKLRYVTAAYFRVFETAPLLGRALDERDMTPDSTAVVLSQGLWTRRFGGDRAILGKEIRLNDEPRQVVGVMPEAFETAGGRVDAWTPFVFTPGSRDAEMRMAHYLGVVARMKPGVTLANAVHDVKSITAQAAIDFPQSNKNISATVKSMRDERGATERYGVIVLAWAAGVVLLIACANLASLQLARGVARAREFGIRAAMGASRGRLVRQLLVESLLLASLGTVAGLLCGMWLLDALAAIAPAEIRIAAAAGVDGHVIGYAMGLAVVSAFAFATGPAWRSATGANVWLRQRTETGDRAATAWRAVLVTAQIASAVVLVVGATLLVTSLVRVLRVDPGFDAHGVFTFDVSTPGSRYDTFDKREQLFSRIASALAGLPGVTSTCVINEIPFDAAGGMTYVPAGQERPVGAFPRNVTAGCFSVLGLHLQRGRAFTDHEHARVGIVTASFARAAWPNQDPIGRQVHLGTKDGDLIDIVGVVADSLQFSLERKAYPQFYEVASAAAAFEGNRMLVRATVPPASLFAAVRAAVRRVDDDQPVAHLRTLEEVVGASLSEREFDLSLITSFSCIALFLAAIGIAGLLAHVVAQRANEIGIRLALGATPRSVVRLVMRGAWIAVGVGVPAGVAGAIALSHFLQRVVFGVSTTAPLVYAAAAGALALIALIAGWIPARRAARVDPMHVLRN